MPPGGIGLYAVNGKFFACNPGGSGGAFLLKSAEARHGQEQTQDKCADFTYGVFVHGNSKKFSFFYVMSDGGGTCAMR